MAVPGALPPPQPLGSEKRRLGPLTLTAKIGTGRRTHIHLGVREGTSDLLIIRELREHIDPEVYQAELQAGGGLEIGQASSRVLRSSKTTLFLGQPIIGESVATILDALIRQQRTMEVAVAVTLARAVAGRLALLGPKRFHGDLVPHHVLVGYDGQVHVLDPAGPAWRERARDPSRRGYRSPEHLRGEAVVPASDAFVLGILLFELTVGARLFDDGTTREIEEAIVSGRVPRPRDVAGESYPIQLQLVLRRLLRPAVGGRFNDPGSVEEALRIMDTPTDESPQVQLGGWLQNMFPERFDAWSKLVPPGSVPKLEPKPEPHDRTERITSRAKTVVPGQAAPPPARASSIDLDLSRAASSPTDPHHRITHPKVATKIPAEITATDRQGPAALAAATERLQLEGQTLDERPPDMGDFDALLEEAISEAGTPLPDVVLNADPASVFLPPLHGGVIPGRSWSQPAPRTEPQALPGSLIDGPTEVTASPIDRGQTLRIPTTTPDSFGEPQQDAWAATVPGELDLLSGATPTPLAEIDSMLEELQAIGQNTPGSLRARTPPPLLFGSSPDLPATEDTDASSAPFADLEEPWSRAPATPRPASVTEVVRPRGALEDLSKDLVLDGSDQGDSPRIDLAGDLMVPSTGAASADVDLSDGDDTIDESSAADILPAEVVAQVQASVYPDPTPLDAGELALYDTFPSAEPTAPASDVSPEAPGGRPAAPPSPDRPAPGSEGLLKEPPPLERQQSVPQARVPTLIIRERILPSGKPVLSDPALAPHPESTSEESSGPGLVIPIPDEMIQGDTLPPPPRRRLWIPVVIGLLIVAALSAVFLGLGSGVRPLITEIIEDESPRDTPADRGRGTSEMLPPDRRDPSAIDSTAAGADQSPVASATVTETSSVHRAEVTEPAEAPEPKEAAPVIETRFRVKVAPRWARVYVDGRRLRGNGLVVLKKDKPVRIEARAKGYQEHVELVEPGRTQPLLLMLKKQKKRAPVQVAKKPTAAEPRAASTDAGTAESPSSTPDAAIAETPAAASDSPTAAEAEPPSDTEAASGDEAKPEATPPPPKEKSDPTEEKLPAEDDPSDELDEPMEDQSGDDATDN